MLFEKVSYTSAALHAMTQPGMLTVRQKFSRDRVEDVAAATAATLGGLVWGDLRGKRIGITAGSRLIANLPEVLRVVVGFLREKGAEPFILPAMGSHGGATAEGQTEMLAGYGISEETVGAPVVSDMGVREIGTTSFGTPVYCSNTALEADGIIICARIKPHTSIDAPVESGLCKMMAVGMGKHRGAVAFHKHGYHRLGAVLLELSAHFLKKVPVLCALAIVENAADETMRIEAVPRERILEREKELLVLAKANMPRFLVDEIDVLVVDRIGKDVSGAGMDPNITGRSVSPLPDKPSIPINCIVALDLTDASHGNATGIGAVDIITRRFFAKIDFGAMYTNVLSSGALKAARIPVVLADDREAVLTAMGCAPKNRPEDVRVARILDTLHLDRIQLSANYRDEITGNPAFEILGGEKAMGFDETGRIAPFPG